MKSFELNVRLIARLAVVPAQLRGGPAAKRAFSCVSWLALAMLALSLCAAPAKGQGFTFSDFSSTTGLTLDGNAAQFNGKVLRLTPTTMHNVGGAWFNTPQPVSGGFTTIFTFQISSTGTNFPADGIAFVIQNDTRGTSALGGDGGCIGYSGDIDRCVGTGISNSLAVELDTFGGNAGDPDSNHIAVQSCGTVANSSNETACNFGVANNAVLTGAGLTLADGNPHTLEIVYNQSAFCNEVTQGTLNINLLNFKATNLLSACVGNLATLLGLGTGGTAFVGFTGATGALVENNDILNWQWNPGTSFTTPQQPIAAGATTTFTDPGVMDQSDAFPAGTDTGGAAFMSVTFMQVSQSVCNQILADSATNGPNTWSGGSRTPAGSSCTVMAGTGTSSANDTPIVALNQCFDSNHNLLPGSPDSCNITAPSGMPAGGPQITLTSHYGTESGKQPNPAYFMCSDNTNDCADILTGDPCISPCTVSGGTNKINSREIIGMLPPLSTCLLYDPTMAVKSGSTIPLKMYLCDSTGSDVSGASLVVHATRLVKTTNTTTDLLTEDSTSANPDFDFRFDATLGPSGGYIFNLKTTGLTKGTYDLFFTAGFNGEQLLAASPISGSSFTFQVK